MSEDISGFGFTQILTASVTFPSGILLSSYADDGDPNETPSLQIADGASGLNGDLIHWTKANPIKKTISVIPASIDDINLGILFQANRPGKFKIPVRDLITLVETYPNGLIATYIGGFITDGIPGYPIASAGRLKTKPYSFIFESVIYS